MAESTMRTKVGTEIRWFKLAIMVVVHFGGFYGYYLLLTAVHWQTIWWTYFLTVVSGIGTGKIKIFSLHPYHTFEKVKEKRGDSRIRGPIVPFYFPEKEVVCS